MLGEGAGILVLESLEHAQARGAKILAELAGFGMTSDAKDMVNPDIEGPKEAMRLALEDAELAPSDIDYLNAHGTATTINDVNETRAIKAVFGDHAKKLAISSTKSMHGHPLGAGGGIEAVACIKAMEENWVPPTIGLDEPDPECDLDYVPNVGRDIRSPTRCRTRSRSAVSTRCWCSAPRRPDAAASRPSPPSKALRPQRRGAFACKPTRISPKCGTTLADICKPVERDRRRLHFSRGDPACSCNLLGLSEISRYLLMMVRPNERVSGTAA